MNSGFILHFSYYSTNYFLCVTDDGEPFFHTDFNLAKFYGNLNQMSVDFQKMIEKSKKNYFPDFLDAIKKFSIKKVTIENFKVPANFTNWNFGY